MDTTGSPGETPEIAAQVRLIVGRVARRLRQAKLAAGDLALSEASALTRLDTGGPSSPSALAAVEGVRPQAMAATLAGLENRGLIARTPDETDGRRAILTITAAGAALVADRRSIANRLLTEVIEAEFDDTERRALASALPLLDRLAARL